MKINNNIESEDTPLTLRVKRKIIMPFLKDTIKKENRISSVKTIKKVYFFQKENKNDENYPTPLKKDSEKTIINKCGNISEKLINLEKRIQNLKEDLRLQFKNSQKNLKTTDSNGKTKIVKESKEDKNKFFYYLTNVFASFALPTSNLNYFQKLFYENFSETIKFLHISKIYRKFISQKKKKEIFLDKKHEFKDKKTLIFDLDETLIHTVRKGENFKSEIKISINASNENNSKFDLFINIRPYALEILEELHKKFEIIIFTASEKCYADAIINYLDPNKKLIQHRLYRNNCIQTKDGYFIKDLSILNRNLKDVFIVDNCAISYAFQINNAIPIIPFYDNKKDCELKKLTEFLYKIDKSFDVRDELRDYFKFENFEEFNDSNNLIQSLYFNRN